jgi:hypothetical protein
VKAELVSLALKIAECSFLKEFFVSFLAGYDVKLLEHTINQRASF